MTNPDPTKSAALIFRNSLLPAEDAWLSTVLTMLREIHTKRREGDSFSSAFCILEMGDYYVQFRAPFDQSTFIAESVSAMSVPALESAITAESADHLKQFGFQLPAESPNYSKVIEIDSEDDVLDAAILALRVLKSAYGLRDFTFCSFKIRIPQITRESKTTTTGPKPSNFRERTPEESRGGFVIGGVRKPTPSSDKS